MSSTPQNELSFADVYIDESSQTNHRYLVLGGIITLTADVAKINDVILKARLPELPAGIMKWTKVSRSKLAAYKRVVDRFFEIPILDFHSLVVDSTKQKHRIYNQGSSEIGFNKELYQLAMKFGRLYNHLFHIYPDRRTTNQRTEDLRLMLNRGIRKNGDQRDWPFRRLQFREPDDSQVLQLSDVLTGAVAFFHNGHGRLPGASPTKIELSEYIFEKAKITHPYFDTAVRGKFTIWHRQLR
jgi:Protein of unknown function (DUF3800)